MAKSLTAPYEAGRRGAGWLKVKPVHTLDLVVLAVEWGSGRCTGKLSNVHLGARDPVTGGFVMLGKTLQGMTDAILNRQRASKAVKASVGALGGIEGIGGAHPQVDSTPSQLSSNRWPTSCSHDQRSRELA